jgi:DNA-binding transcriptional ArsR family regulator
MDKYQREAALLKAVAHPVRLHIVDLLRAEPQCVCHLSAALDKSQPYVSQQLAILRNAGVIVDEREGTNIFYRLVEANLVRQVEAAPIGEAPHGRQRVHGCGCPKCTGAVGNFSSAQTVLAAV